MHGKCLLQEDWLLAQKQQQRCVEDSGWDWLGLGGLSLDGVIYFSSLQVESWRVRKQTAVKSGNVGEYGVIFPEGVVGG